MCAISGVVAYDSDLDFELLDPFGTKERKILFRVSRIEICIIVSVQPDNKSLPTV